MLKMMITSALLCIVPSFAGANSSPVVSDVRAVQRQHTALVDVTYDFTDADGDAAFISLMYSVDGGASWLADCTTVFGDVGAGVEPGSDLHAVWDAGVDYPGQLSEQFVIRVYADDSSEGFVTVASGTFMMGSPTNEPGRDSDEPRHEVTLTGSFLMQSTEVTNAQYAELAQWARDHGHCTATTSSLSDALDGSTQELLDLDDPECEISFSNDVFSVDAGKEDHPVKEVTWYGAAAYCDWLSLQEGLPRAYDHATWRCNGHAPYDAAGYRLPTEAEWEYACRAGSTSAFANGAITDTVCDDPVLDQIGWYCGNANDWTHPVGELIPNAWSLYDMHGNLWEWCNDWYGSYGGDETDPGGPWPGSGRVIRGGGWNRNAQDCRSANRSYSNPYSSYSHIVFRPVRSTP